MERRHGCVQTGGVPRGTCLAPRIWYMSPSQPEREILAACCCLPCFTCTSKGDSLGRRDSQRGKKEPSKSPHLLQFIIHNLALIGNPYGNNLRHGAPMGLGGEEIPDRSVCAGQRAIVCAEICTRWAGKMRLQETGLS